MNRILSAVAVLALTSGAMASFSNTESHNATWSFPLSPGSAVLNFAGFDTQGGLRVLKAIELNLDGLMQATVQATNDSGMLVNGFGVSMTGIVSVSGPGALSAGLGIVESAGPVPAQPGETINFGTLIGSDTDSALLIFPGQFVPFLDVPTVSASVNGSGGFATSGTSDATIQFSDFGTSGKATLTYYFDIIPTPGALALFGIAGLAGIRRRRA
jgi:hypothetical protein